MRELKALLICVICFEANAYMVMNFQIFFNLLGDMETALLYQETKDQMEDADVYLTENEKRMAKQVQCVFQKLRAYF